MWPSRFTFGRNEQAPVGVHCAGRERFRCFWLLVHCLEAGDTEYRRSDACIAEIDLQRVAA
jgi:hypothetical protein